MIGWLTRWQQVVCLTVAAAFVLLLIVFGGDGDAFSAPYVATFMFIATWVVCDFVIAYLITRNERLVEEATQPTKKPRLETSPPPPVTRARLPRAIARLRAR